MTTIAMTPISSSTIAEAGRDEEGVLLLRFKPGKNGGPGKLYRYPGIPAEVLEAFEAAESKGSFFGQAIRPFYPGVLVVEPDPARGHDVGNA